VVRAMMCLLWLGLVRYAFPIDRTEEGRRHFQHG
jgi:hypothetical protein